MTAKVLYAKLKHSLRSRGWQATLKIVISNAAVVVFEGIPHWYGEWRFDRKWGVDTAGRLNPTGDTNVLQYAEPYQATPAAVFELIIRELHIDIPRFSFSDLGCGKGRVVLLATRHPFKQVVGVEFSSELAATAQRNLLHNKVKHVRCTNTAIECTDAVKYAFPDDNAVIFLYNPFKAHVMERVLSNISNSAGTKERYLAYYNPVLAPVLLDRSPHFSLVCKGPCHLKPTYAVYAVHNAAPLPADS
jgi:SAM-dependent methyltransferase